MGFDALQIIGEMLAGLALFFVGIQRLSSHLRQITGRKFRMLLQRVTQSSFLSAFAGALLGATMQTGSAITLIRVSMVGAGMITVDRSLPVRLGAAVGTSTMVFVATNVVRLPAGMDPHEGIRFRFAGKKVLRGGYHGRPYPLFLMAMYDEPGSEDAMEASEILYLLEQNAAELNPTTRSGIEWLVLQKD